jgi:hypothetical protein
MVALIQDRKKFLTVVSTHGRIRFDWDFNETILGVLNKNSIPWVSGSLYIPLNDGKLELYPHLDQLAKTYTFDEIQFHLNRNIAPFIFGNYPAFQDKKLDSVVQFLYQDFDSKQVKQPVFASLNEADCRYIVTSNVKEYCSQYICNKKRLLVGISGGGDSNALLYALTQIPEIELYPVIITGLPEWNKGLLRAQALAEKYNLPLKIVSEEQMLSYLGLSDCKEELFNRFQRYFSNDDFEVMAALMIRLALEATAKELDAIDILIGANQDDKLSEAFYFIINGEVPFEIPVRKIGSFNFHYPLWMCPKVIIDGCFPKYSLENYQDRYPSFSPGRSLYYQLAYHVISNFPGIGEKILLSQERRTSTERSHFIYDSDLGWYVFPGFSLSVKQKLLKFLGKSHGKDLGELYF